MIDMLFDYLPAPNELHPLEGFTNQNELVSILTTKD
jgi:hypothetical protein